ncbi:MAG TPA: hypothetical protein VIU12_02035 [Chryseolinea sp.]
MKSEKTDTAEARHALEDQLMNNLLTLAIAFKRNPDAGMAYFDQSIIRPANSADDEEPVLAGSTAALAHA